MTNQSGLPTFLLHPGSPRALSQFRELILVRLLVEIEKHKPQGVDSRTT